MTPTFQRILVPIDFSPASEVAVSCALSLAEKYVGKVHLLYAWAEFVPPQPDLMFWANRHPITHEQMHEEAERWMRDFVSSRGLSEQTIVSSAVTEGVADAVILGTAEAMAADLVVMGTHGRTGVPHLLIGSVAEKVVRLAKCPVLTVHAPASATPA
ncbi:MAG TPA: universal stress protein [Polyangiaceae bacterium]